MFAEEPLISPPMPEIWPVKVAMPPYVSSLPPPMSSVMGRAEVKPPPTSSVPLLIVTPDGAPSRLSVATRTLPALMKVPPA